MRRRIWPLRPDFFVLGNLSQHPVKRKEIMMAYKFEVYKDKRGDFRFRFKAPNGESMFSSEGYKQKASAMNAIESIKKNAPGAEVEEQK